MAREPGDNGGSTKELAASDAQRLEKAAASFGKLRLSADHLRTFAEAPGSDDEPWDVVLSLLATDEQRAMELLSERTGLPFVAEPRLEESAVRFYELVPPDIAREHHLAGLEQVGSAMVVATAQPMQPSVFQMLEERLGMPVRLVLSPRGAVAGLINRGYEQQGDLVTEIVDEMPFDESAIASAAGSITQGNDLLAMARQTPVIRLVNMILFEAIRRRASDVHIHPEENRLVIRYRVDGMLVDAFSPPTSLASAISSRIKVMTELDIANRHSPQDGYTSVRVGSKKIDIRLSVIPTVYGERLVMRLLDQSQTQLSLDQVGMTEAMQTELMDIVDRPNGMLLVTGPTGSGKTTTLYAALQKIDRATRNVMTIEDPVEYHLEGISQMQVNPKRDVTFAKGLRALLRQDPDVILVGEIRDQETAQLAIQASLTGHFVLATLHTNDAPGAIPRLIDIGLEPFLITSSLLGVLAQRLVRKICPTCNGTAFEHSHTGNAKRCDSCLGTGYRGRLAVYEIMKMNDTLRRLTAQNADGVTLYEAAVDAGFKPMREDALDKVKRGLTDQSEVYRVLH
ncbi:MAG: Flp pilus assembly complex ATPase component TadA [Phycisphaerales bacterium]|nr:Flp pilus assembly complex ATPase component TadA [Phycisphaerales bacterium]MCB9837067.1 Flp pilus assembly complex ATPase component TadA [Phycisphaera sp.]